MEKAIHRILKPEEIDQNIIYDVILVNKREDLEKNYNKIQINKAKLIAVQHSSKSWDILRCINGKKNKSKENNANQFRIIELIHANEDELAPVKTIEQALKEDELKKAEVAKRNEERERKKMERMKNVVTEEDEDKGNDVNNEEFCKKIMENLKDEKKTFHKKPNKFNKDKKFNNSGKEINFEKAKKFTRVKQFGGSTGRFSDFLDQDELNQLNKIK